MTYEHNLKNIEVLKNLIRPWEVDYIFFDYNTGTEFEIIFFDKENSEKIDLLLPVKHNARLPFAHIHENKYGQDILYYKDYSFTYKYNLTTDHIIMSSISGQFKSCPAQMKLEMAALARKLKNM